MVLLYTEGKGIVKIVFVDMFSLAPLCFFFQKKEKRSQENQKYIKYLLNYTLQHYPCVVVYILSEEVLTTIYCGKSGL